MIYPNGHIDYLMYENGGALIGVAKVTMPPHQVQDRHRHGRCAHGRCDYPPGKHD